VSEHAAPHAASVSAKPARSSRRIWGGVWGGSASRSDQLCHFSTVSALLHVLDQGTVR